LLRKTAFIAIIFILFLVPAACKNGATEKEDTKSYKITNGGFETGDLTGWTVLSGDAFNPAGVSDEASYLKGGVEVPYDKEGRYFYAGGVEKKTGRMRSESFIVGGANYISFRLGAGRNVALTYISIVEEESDRELCRFGNTLFSTDEAELRENNMVLYYANLSVYKGKKVYILVVDESTANYGCLVLDDFVTYYPEKPDLAGAFIAEDIKPIFSDLAGTPNALYNGDFSRGLSGWQVIGEADSFLPEHINSSGRLSNRPNEGAVGVLRSGSFKVGGANLMSFRLGATKNPELTYLSVKKVGTNEEVFRTYSDRWKESDEENTHLYFIDLSPYRGERLYLEFVDNSRGDWGLLTIESVYTYYADIPQITDEVAVNLREKINTSPEYQKMRRYVNGIIAGVADPEIRLTLEKTFYATIDGVQNIKGSWPGVLRYEKSGGTFVYTGDIPAMWLRDSSAQVLPYLQFMNLDEDVKLMVRGLLKKQFMLIRRDPYANAFNRDGSVFERKFELDSLAYPIWLASEYYRITGDGSIFDAFFVLTARKIVETYRRERNHSDEVYRVENEHDRAASVNEFNPDSGLIWSGYRPSDDVTYYKFFIPGNMFAVAALERIAELLAEFNLDAATAAEADAMAREVREAIETYGVYNHPKYGKIYAFEVDGMTADADSAAGKLLMDAANIPSLLSAPWLGYLDADDEIYQNTRRFILSRDNPYYYEGKYASGIGDPHDEVSHGENPHSDVPVPWHMAIAMQALTSDDPEEVALMVEYMTATTGGTYVMHEAFNADDPTIYSRDYFTWPCALYAHTVLTRILGVNEGEMNEK
jgi:meiotically up-regulated gene 157 (Mug157) protein